MFEQHLHPPLELVDTKIRMYAYMNVVYIFDHINCIKSNQEIIIVYL